MNDDDLTLTQKEQIRNLTTLYSNLSTAAYNATVSMKEFIRTLEDIKKELSKE